MCRTQGCHHSGNEVIIAHHFNTIFFECFQLVLRTDEWITASQRPKLPLPGHLPRAVFIVPDASGTSGKNGGLHRLQMSGWHIEAQFHHDASPPIYQPSQTLALRNRRMVGASSAQSSGRQEFCTARNTRSGCGIITVARPSTLQTPAIPMGDVLGFCG